MLGYNIDFIGTQFNPFINELTYKGANYRVAARIQQLRLALLIHSRLYYLMDVNIITDQQWNNMAYELRDLQKKYPDDAIAVVYHHDFADWDGTTGFNLPLNDPWVIRKANQAIHRYCH